MKRYAGTTGQFRADARMHRIAERLRAEYTTEIGHRPALLVDLAERMGRDWRHTRA